MGSRGGKHHSYRRNGGYGSSWAIAWRASALHAVSTHGIVWSEDADVRRGSITSDGGGKKQIVARASQADQLGIVGPRHGWLHLVRLGRSYQSGQTSRLGQRRTTEICFG